MKYTCKECGEVCTCNVGFTPVNCLKAKYEKPVWVGEDDMILTREVFMWDDCPAWAEYACVNGYGTLVFTEKKPYIVQNDYWSCNGKIYSITKVRFCAENWKTNIIKRHRLPEWCVQDTYLYDTRLNEYGMITDITGLDETVSVLYVGNKDITDLSEQYVNDNCIEACRVEYEDKDMQELVGQVIIDRHDDMYLVSYYDTEGFVSVKGKDLYSIDLMSYRKKDGTPCCNLKRKEEDGEWYLGKR